MIFYSPVPIEAVYEGYDQMKLNYRELQLGHITMVVEQLTETEGRVVRIISPYANDYLNPQYQPGQMLAFRPDIS